MDFNIITFLQLAIVAIPFLTMIAISVVLIVEERHKERRPRPSGRQERLLGEQMHEGSEARRTVVQR